MHARTAAQLFDVPVDQVDREQRGVGKLVNFATIYGQGATALGQILGIARKAGLLEGHAMADDFGECWRQIEWMGMQRHLKVAGIFARLTLRDDKPKYLADAPRFLHYIRSTANRYRQLGPLLQLVDEIEGTTPVTGFAYGRM